MIDGFGHFLEEAGLLNSEKQTKVLRTVCWVSNHIRDMKNRAQWYPKSIGNVSLHVKQSMVALLLAMLSGMSSFLKNSMTRD